MLSRGRLIGSPKNDVAGRSDNYEVLAKVLQLLKRVSKPIT